MFDSIITAASRTEHAHLIATTRSHEGVPAQGNLLARVLHRLRPTRALAAVHPLPASAEPVHPMEQAA